MADPALRPQPLQERYGRLLSCSIPCQGLSLLRFLAAAEGQARSYFASPGRAASFAGVGTAVELMAWGPSRFGQIASEARDLFAGAHLENADSPLASPRLFGGFAFSSDFTPDNTWSIYAPALFTLPHYQLARQGERMWLTINVQIQPDEQPAALVPDLRAALVEKLRQLKADDARAARQAQSGMQSLAYPMSAGMWASMLDAATERIRAGELSKVVLARTAELRFDGRIRPLPALRYLAAHYADCYRFHYEPRPYHSFYGASPELLAAVQGRRLESMALAGSMPRGANTAQDQALGQALMQSDKDRHEHQIVVEKMRQRLQAFADDLDIAPLRLLKLSNIQHLLTPIHCRMRAETGILPLIEALHPTPALGGDPRPKALRLIRELEPIPRGWYGAPVGWIDTRLQGEFAVAIRSAVAQEERAWICAGAGIVAASQPESEWEETALKLRPMLDAHSFTYNAFSPQRHRGTEKGKQA